jgi:hypothetical protein
MTEALTTKRTKIAKDFTLPVFFVTSFEKAGAEWVADRGRFRHTGEGRYPG